MALELQLMSGSVLARQSPPDGAAGARPTALSRLSGRAQRTVPRGGTTAAHDPRMSWPAGLLMLS